jgi:Cytochrome b5-like Heme/Steroid binding domain
VLLDDLILDVSQFKFEHPGGSFLLHSNIGRDISKFFYGGYTFEAAGYPLHAHSNAIARQVVNSLAIGRLTGDATENKASMVGKEEINKQTAVFTFKGSGLKLSKIEDDVGMFGRHFLVKNGNGIGVERQYTIVRCMGPKVYQSYVKALTTG